MEFEHRRSVRFLPDEKEIAIVSFNEHDFEKYEIEKHQFKGELYALIDDEAHKGCSLVFIDYKESFKEMDKGVKLVVKIGEVQPLRGEVIWKKEMGDKILKIGVKFLD